MMLNYLENTRSSVIMKHYIHIIDEMINKSNLSLKDIEMILPEEKEQIYKFNDNKTDYPKKQYVAYLKNKQ